MIHLELFWTFFLIGAFTFGGGYAMLPLIQEQVAAKGWLESQQIMDFIAVSESTPGPFAVNMATYVGAEVGGVFGSVCATLGVVLPSFLIILAVARCYNRFCSSRLVKSCMIGLKSAVVGLISAAMLNMAATVFFPAGFTAAVLTEIPFYLSICIFAVSLFLALKKHHPILVICLAAALGIMAGYTGLL